MKVLIVFCLAIASTCAFKLKALKFVDISPVVPFFEPESRITNGSPAKADQIPYQAGLHIVTSAGETGYVWCGGSLIAPTWILTAAHCTEGVYSITAYLGSTSYQRGTSVKVTEIIVHNGWNTPSQANDISLLRIPAVAYSSSIQAVALPAESVNSSYVDEVAIASGWGQTDEDGTLPNALQFAEFTIIANCWRISNICVATHNGTSTCFGDSGGPLVLKSSGVLVGVDSYVSYKGCTKNEPAGFTRVTSYRGWIKEKTGI